MWGHTKAFRGDFVPHERTSLDELDIQVNAILFQEIWICRRVCISCVVVNVRLGCGGEQGWIVFLLPPAIDPSPTRRSVLKVFKAAQVPSKSWFRHRETGTSLLTTRGILASVCRRVRKTLPHQGNFHLDSPSIFGLGLGFWVQGWVGDKALYFAFDMNSAD